MATDLLDSVNGVFNIDLIRKAASTLGESEEGISKALAAGVPSLLSGIINTAGFDGGNNLLNLSKQSAATDILDNPSALFGGPNSSELMARGGSMLSGLFGSKSGGLSSLVGHYAGVQSSTSHAILSAIAPIALAFLGRHALANNLNGGSLLSWLTGQKDHINNAIPAGVNLSGLFDGTAPKMTEPIKKTTTSSAPKKQNKMLLPILLALAGVALIWQMMKGCNTQNSNPSPAVEAPATTGK
jgi:hypothetical protein